MDMDGAMPIKGKPRGRTPTPLAPDQFLLSVNGVPTAWTDPHAAAVEWFA